MSNSSIEEQFNIYNILEDSNENNKKIIEKEENESSSLFSNSYLKKNKIYRKDNIRSKIINNFSNFLINFLNDYVVNVFKYQKVVFFKPNYLKRKNVDIKSISEFMNLSIEEFCSLDISSKIKKYPLNHNLKAFNIVKNSLDYNFINQKISKFYQNFYLNQKNILKNYNLREKTRNFSFLLKQYDSKQKYKEKLYDTGMNLVTEFIHKKRKNKPNEDKILDSEIEKFTLKRLPSFNLENNDNNFYDDNYDLNLTNLNFLNIYNFF